MTPPPAHLAVGARVVVHGLAGRPEFNGCSGMAVSWDGEKERVGIKLDTGEKLSLKPSNLQRAERVSRPSAGAAIDLEAEKQKAVAALAAGRTHVAQYTHPSGWVVRTHRAPILKNSELTTSAYSQGAWRRELGLTLYAGQHLPGLLYGGNRCAALLPVLSAVV